MTKTILVRAEIRRLITLQAAYINTTSKLLKQELKKQDVYAET